MADSPVAKWLLYGNDTPVRDFLTNDNNLRTAQNVALGVSVGALAVAGGVALAPTAAGAFGTAGTTAGAGSLASTAAPLATVGSGIVAANPNLPEELGEGLEGALPAAESELGTLARELEESLPSTAEQAATQFQDIVGKAQNFLRANPDLVMELGGSSRGAPISANQLGAAIGQYSQGNPGFARALGGNAMEAIANAIIEDLPPGDGSFLQVSGPGRIDFIGTGAFQGYTFELTTEAGVAGHAVRAYMQEPGSMIFTYLPIIE